MAKISKKTRQKVRKTARGCCEYCQSQEVFSPTGFSIEHIIPISKAGTSDFNNLALACQGCNNFKYNKTHHLDAASQLEVPLFNPRVDQWQQHFKWNNEFNKIIGLTAKGRATINCLHLNRKEVVNLRNLLIIFGEHPPK